MLLAKQLTDSCFSQNRDHLAALKPNVDTGFWIMGGATLDAPIEDGKPPQINGSVMMALAETKDEVLAKLREDVYFKDGVWDWDKVRHASFLPFVRLCF